MRCLFTASKCRPPGQGLGHQAGASSGHSPFPGGGGRCPSPGPVPVPQPRGVGDGPGGGGTSGLAHGGLASGGACGSPGPSGGLDHAFLGVEDVALERQAQGHVRRGLGPLGALLLAGGLPWSPASPLLEGRRQDPLGLGAQATCKHRRGQSPPPPEVPFPGRLHPVSPGQGQALGATRGHQRPRETGPCVRSRSPWPRRCPSPGAPAHSCPPQAQDAGVGTGCTTWGDTASCDFPWGHSPRAGWPFLPGDQLDSKARGVLAAAGP